MKNHREEYPYGSVTYWKGGVAANKDEDWTVCRVQAPVGIVFGMEFYREEVEKGHVARLLQMLNAAYQAGEKAKLREIKGVLGI